MEDLSKSPQLSKQISKKRSIVDSGSESSADLIRQPLLRSTRANTDKRETVIEVNYEELEAEKEDLTSFSRHYAEFNQYNDPGTILELKMNEFTYKINYCNMITLLKEFSKNVYKDYNIDIKNGMYGSSISDLPMSSLIPGSGHILNSSRATTPTFMPVFGVTMMGSLIF